MIIIIIINTYSLFLNLDRLLIPCNHVDIAHLEQINITLWSIFEYQSDKPFVFEDMTNSLFFTVLGKQKIFSLFKVTQKLFGLITII